MNISQKKIQYFETALADFFSKVGREHLPWRKKKISAYEVWVSEVMLQQTQVNRVIGYYDRFLERYPTIEVLAQSDWEEFLPYYEGLGYYARGRNMLKAAKEIVEKYQGKFPRDTEALQKLPGIGPYTASAILSFAYGENHLAWDTNLKRVIGRFFFGRKNIDVGLSFRPSLRAEESQRKKTRSLDKLGMTIAEYLENSFSLSAKTLNAALMDFGSAICLARPKCEACMLQKKCLYYKEKGIQEVKEKKQKTNNKQQKESGNVEVIVFLHENHRKYFSENRKKYTPFVLPRGYESRAGIKEWFLKKYNFRVAVRPSHEKRKIGKVTQVLINAQILSGKQAFHVFSKENFKKWYTGRK